MVSALLWIVSSCHVIEARFLLINDIEQCQTVGASMGLTTACPNQGDKSCQVSCQDPTASNQCVVLQSMLVDGSPCGTSYFNTPLRHLTQDVLGTLNQVMVEHVSVAIVNQAVSWIQLKSVFCVSVHCRLFSRPNLSRLTVMVHQESANLHSGNHRRSHRCPPTHLRHLLGYVSPFAVISDFWRFLRPMTRIFIFILILFFFFPNTRSNFMPSS